MVKYEIKDVIERINNGKLLYMMQIEVDTTEIKSTGFSIIFDFMPEEKYLIEKKIMEKIKSIKSIEKTKAEKHKHFLSLKEQFVNTKGIIDGSID